MTCELYCYTLQWICISINKIKITLIRLTNDNNNNNNDDAGEQNKKTILHIFQLLK